MRDKGEDGDNVTRVRSTDRVRQQRGHHRGMGINEGLCLCVVYALYVTDRLVMLCQGCMYSDRCRL